MSAEKNHEQRLTSSRLHDEILASSGEKRTARLRIPLGTILKLNEMHFLKQISSLTSSLSSSLLFNSLFSFSVLQVHQLRFQSFAMFVVNTPKKKLRFTNYAYCSLGDFRKFAIPRSSSAQVIVRDSVVLSLAIHNKIIDGQIALNFVQREHIEVSVGDQISVTPFFPPASFSLALLTLELEHDKENAKRYVKLDATALAQHLHKKFSNQVMTTGQRVLFKFLGNEYIFTVNQAWVKEQETSNAIERGIATNDTYIVFVAASSSQIKIINQRKAVSSVLWQKGFNLQKFGIGGLGEEFAQIFRRGFASRLFPPHVINKLGIKHVKGMLLYGPPGTGKTLMARQIGKLLSEREPKIVNGPEVMNEYAGVSERNVRNLFVEAEQEQRARGDQSDLHVIIFDEIDSISKPRGLRSDSGIQDSVVNQLLTKIDGVEVLNNILIIGTTNRRELIDVALLRPGRLEVHVEVNLPDENGRLQILQIHTNKLKENYFLAADVNLQELAALTKNFSGAELEGVIKNAVSIALDRQFNMDDRIKALNEENIKITMDDLLKSLREIIPSFGVSTNVLSQFRFNGMIDCGERHKQIYEGIMLLVKKVKESRRGQLFSCLLEGPRGSGKTTIAATIGVDSDFPYVKIVSTTSMRGLNESSKCAEIVKVFEDAFKSQLSIIILDDIERLLEYVVIGPQFSNLITQSLLDYLNSLPPKGKNMLVIGTTSEVEFLGSMGFCDSFSVTYHVPALAKIDVIKVLEHFNICVRDDVIFETLDEMPLKKLYSMISMATRGDDEENSEAIWPQKEKIDINYFYNRLSDYAERRRKLGLPPEDPAATKPTTIPAAEEKKSALLIKPVTKLEQMRDCLRSLKQNHKEEDAKVKRAFQTLLTYVGNVSRNPNEEKFRKIRLNNATFQDRVGSLHGGIEFLEICGFEKQEGGEFLFLPRDKVDMVVLNSAGSELNSAITNPFFGIL